MIPSEPLDFLGQLRRLRRRAIVVTFIRYATFAGLVVIAVVTGLLFAGRVMALWTLAGAGAGTLVIMGLLAFRRRPSLREAALTIDSKGGFDNCVTTALQFAGTADPVVQLIVRDAESRLQRVRASEVFPLRFDISSRAFGTAAAIAVVVFAVGRTGVTPAPTTGDRDSPTAAGPSDGPGSRAGNGQTSRPGPAASRPGVASTMRVSTAVAAGTEEARTRADSTTASNPRSSEDHNSASATELPGSPAQPSTPRADNEHDTNGSGTPTAAKASNGGRAAASATQAPTGRGAGAGSGVPTLRDDARAGGARGGNAARATGAGASTQNRGPADYAQQYRAAAAGAEQALEREQIPSDLQDSVRGYFTAIRP